MRPRRVIAPHQADPHPPLADLEDITSRLGALIAAVSSTTAERIVSLYPPHITGCAQKPGWFSFAEDDWHDFRSRRSSCLGASWRTCVDRSVPGKKPDGHRYSDFREVFDPSSWW